MKDKIIVRKSEKLLNIAKMFFGDILVSAYLTHYDTDDDEFENQIKLDKEEESVGLDQSGNLDLSTSDYIFEFSNGNVISIGVSEWGSISDRNDYELVIN